MEIGTREDIIGKKLTIDHFFVYEVTIVGILDTNFDLEYFEDYLFNDSRDNVAERRYRGISQYGMHNAIYVNSGFCNSDSVSRVLIA